MIYLFIDTNIYLKLYEFHKNELYKLHELNKNVSEGKIELILPEQVKDEVKRRREKILKTTLELLERSIPSFPICPIYHDFPEVKTITNLERVLQAKTKVLIDKLKKQIRSKTLNADSIIKDLFSKATLLKLTDEIYTKAKRRFERGNPPGKSGSYGDAINWETLLQYVPEKEDLFFVGGDIDFVSPLDKNYFSEFLTDEWYSEKKSKIHYFEYITKFLRNEYPEVKIRKSDIENEKKINVLRAYSDEQLRELSERARRNLLFLEAIKESKFVKQMESQLDIIKGVLIPEYKIPDSETVRRLLESVKRSGHQDENEQKK